MAGFPNVRVAPALEARLSPLKAWLDHLRQVVNNLMRGKTNNFGALTLTANASSTVLTDANIGGSSVILLSPVTANAAAEVGAGTIYPGAPGNQAVTINHANNAQTDRSFNYVVVG
jgi:bifunctional N-acetylglucosamine-1-phosphate-uridyltransferase/glucosamine-1-phosphate-acetyltransferase GlmU-like protein